MDKLIAQNEALQQCFIFHKSQDTLNKTMFLSLAEPGAKITFDISRHLQHMPSSHILPDELWAGIFGGLSGFTATHHQLGNHIVECNEDLTKACVTAKVAAFHSLEQDGVVSSVTAYVDETMDFEKWQGKWVLRRVMLERSVPLENETLFLVARENAERGDGRTEASVSAMAEV
ncbi:hypothetical protein LEL_10350 [Akanthomyces lecanii RCEF 1005]|uniref:SnoaL-like domain-containing protein n=1 Tax=Akanthomyces lecanii RCEF 1005 TaxID=1081108 RepID=A0A167ZNG2_CORDF|nr:hypothetical protein LEL_10350 [Akanthomyces lecanii RCEF 1005]